MKNIEIKYNIFSFNFLLIPPYQIEKERIGVKINF